MDYATPTIRDNIELASKHLRGVWRFRFVAVVIAWVVAIGTMAFVYTLPDTYRASTQVFVETDTVLSPLLRGLTVETDVQSDVGLMTRTITSRPILEKVIRATDLDLTATTPLQMEGLLKSIENRIEISANRENIYEIAFVDPARGKALDVVQTLLNTFVEDTLGSGQDDAAQAEQALLTEISDYERRLNQAEDQLTQFKQKNVGMMPGEGGDYYEQLQRALAERGATRELVRVAEQKVAVIQRRLVGEDPVVGIMSSDIGGFASPTSALDTQIAVIEQSLADALQEYTEKHPEVVRARARLQELEDQRQQRLLSMPQDQPLIAAPLEANPVYQNLKIQSNNLEIELASLRQDLVAKTSEARRLENLVDVVPQVEAELTRLNRDYEVVKQRHATMLARWEDLQTAKRVQAGTDAVQFRIIDPPFAPAAPTGPARAMFIFAGLLFALGLGGVFAFALNLLQPIFQSPKDFIPLGLPIIGMVSRQMSVAEISVKKRLNFLFGAAVTALALVTVAAIMFAQPGSALVRGLLA